MSHTALSVHKLTFLMKKPYTNSIPASLAAAIKGIGKSRAELIRTAVVNAEKDPSLLVKAFGRRLQCPTDPEMVEVTYGRDPAMDRGIKKLADMTKLSGQQVLRLCLEAQVEAVNAVRARPTTTTES